MNQAAKNQKLANQLFARLLGIFCLIAFGFAVLLSLRPDYDANPKITANQVAKPFKPAKRPPITVREEQRSKYKNNYSSQPTPSFERVIPKEIKKDTPKVVDIKANMKQAIDLVDSGQANAAVDVLLEILKTDPKNEEALVELGMIYLIDFDSPNGAVEYFERAVQTNPTNRIVASELVTIYQETGKEQAGIEMFDELLRGDPKNSSARMAKAQLLHGSGKIDEATREYETLVADGNQPGHVLMDLGNLHASSGNEEKAAATFGRAAEQANSKAMQTNDLDERRIHFEERNRALYKQAQSLIKLGKPIEARHTLQEILMSNPNHYLAKQALSQLGKSKG